jgi:hypothetical protein
MSQSQRSKPASCPCTEPLLSCFRACDQSNVQQGRRVNLIRCVRHGFPLQVYDRTLLQSRLSHKRITRKASNDLHIATRHTRAGGRCLHCRRTSRAVPNSARVERRRKWTLEEKAALIAEVKAAKVRLAAHLEPGQCSRWLPLLTLGSCHAIQAEPGPLSPYPAATLQGGQLAKL